VPLLLAAPLAGEFGSTEVASSAAPPLRGALVAGAAIARAIGTLVYASVCRFEPPVDANTK
jgi:hypothetical protein